MKIQRINIKEAIFNEPEKIDFVLQGMEAGSVGLLVSAGGTGKSMFSMALAMVLADTTKTLNYQLTSSNIRGKIGIINVEDTEKIIKNRIHHIGQYFLSKTGFKDIVIDTISENLEILSLRGYGVNFIGINEQYSAVYNQKWRDFLTKYSEDKLLVIIDTLSRVHCLNEIDNTNMKELLAIFEEISSKTGTSFLLIHHANKASLKDEDKDQDSVRGASSLVANARYLITLAPLTAKQAKDYNIDENNRKMYVKLSIPKINYTAPIEDIILKRNINYGGILEKVELNKEEKGKQNGKKY